MILLNPGPVNVSPRVTAALARGDLCHREPECTELLERIRTQLVRGVRAARWVDGRPRHRIGDRGGRDGGVERVLRARTARDRGSNGVYGDRMAAMAAAHRLSHTVVGRRVDASAGPRAASRRRCASPTSRRSRSSTTRPPRGCAIPSPRWARCARRHGKLLLVDAVSGLAGDRSTSRPARDLVVGTGNKCIQALPGIAFVLVRDDVLARLVAYRRARCISRCRRTSGAPMPFTPAVQVAYALDEALAELLEEDVAARIARYAGAAALLRAGFARLGLEMRPAGCAGDRTRSPRCASRRDAPTPQLHDGLKRARLRHLRRAGRLRQGGLPRGEHGGAHAARLRALPGGAAARCWRHDRRHPRRRCRQAPPRHVGRQAEVSGRDRRAEPARSVCSTASAPPACATS